MHQGSIIIFVTVINDKLSIITTDYIALLAVLVINAPFETGDHAKPFPVLTKLKQFIIKKETILLAAKLICCTDYRHFVR